MIKAFNRERARRHPERAAWSFEPTFFADDDEVVNLANTPDEWMRSVRGESRKIRLPRTALLSPYYYL
jgi:hypothetical protein